MKKVLMIMAILLSVGASAQTYVSASTSFYNGTGNFGNKGMVTAEVGKKWDVLSIGFAEWVVSDNNPAPNKYNSDDDNNGKWCDAFSEGINRHYYTTEQLYQLYRKQSKQ